MTSVFNVVYSTSLNTIKHLSTKTETKKFFFTDIEKNKCFTKKIVLRSVRSYDVTVRSYDVTVIPQSKSYVKLWYELLFFGLLNIRFILEDLKKLALFFGFTCKFVFFLGCWKNKVQNCKPMKSFYRSSIQLGFSNLKKVRLKSYLSVHTHSISSSSELFRAKMTQIPIEFQMPLFFRFQIWFENILKWASLSKSPPPPPRVRRFNFVTRIFLVLCTRQFQVWPSPGVRSGKPPGTFWWANSSPQGKKKVQNPDLKKRAKTPNPRHFSQIFTGDA